MKKIALLYSILFCATSLPGQNIPVDPEATYIIANGGLNLRSRPDKNSKRIANIPFGATIKYISTQSFGVDSILVHHGNVEIQHFIQGNWVKVEYQKMEGYVLDVYLYYEPQSDQRFNTKLSPEFMLLYPGCGCDAGNLHNPTDWKWSGYFREVEGQYRIEEVSISYYKTRIYTCDLIISASKNDNLSFIIGSKKGKLSPKNMVRGKSIRLYNDNNGTPIKQSDLDDASIEFMEHSNTGQPNALYLTTPQKKQLLNLPEYDYPVEIKFAGDLDGDSKDDFIIHYGDKGSIILLYLTSKARSGNLIQQVALFFASYCC